MHKLPKLPYSCSSLEPHIDEKTMAIHHTKHHQAYVDKLNAAIKGTEFENMEIKELLQNLDKVPENIRTAVRNNGGGHLNHSMFWEVMGPNAGGEAKGAVGEAIKKEFGSFENFKEKFTDVAAKVFGSGWAWLCIDNGKLSIKSTSGHDTPVMEGKTPLLVLDVWEHAYYAKYFWNRPEYIKNWWNVVNWDKANEFFDEAVK
ncbi:superoxide dismutase [Candidatus Woesearchaeota archaeon]|nr:superoxide dismutase [Candidatus Woesearchaeota archaeon]